LGDWESGSLKDPGSEADIVQQCRQDLQPLLGLHLAGVICFGGPQQSTALLGHVLRTQELQFSFRYL